MTHQYIPTHPAATVRLVPESRIEGTRDEVGAALRRYHAQGRLVEFTQSQPIPGSRGRVHVTVRLLPAPQHQPRRSRRRRGAVYLLAGAGLALAAAIGWVIYAAIAWITAHIAITLAALFALAALSAAGGRRVCQTVITVTHRH